jgi:AcrR family transcriptional regulator
LVNGTPLQHRGKRRNAAARILEGAADRLTDVGAVALSLQDVADAAQVSKALIHYHFHDKDEMLARLVEWTTAGLIARERTALDGLTPATAVDALWRWLEHELKTGHLRLLLELGMYRAPLVQAAISEALLARCETAALTVAQLFRLLELRPRVPPELLAGVVVAFIDGLAARGAPEADTRIGFDIFWLGLLSLAE